MRLAEDVLDPSKLNMKPSVAMIMINTATHFPFLTPSQLIQCNMINGKIQQGRF